MDRRLTDARRGLLHGVTCYLMWGLFPLYWPLLEPAGSLEILSHRIVWSLLVVTVLLLLTRSRDWVRPLLRDRALMSRMTLAALLIAGNWAVYIWGVNNEHVIETSLGYFINPVVTVLIGVLVLGERLRPVQWAAIGLGSLAVVVLTADYGRPPWVALTLAFSFAAYGLLKKQVGPRVGAVQSLTVETAILFVPALVFLVALDVTGAGQFGRAGVGAALLLASAGVATAVPLLFFAGAARRLPLSTLGLLQYLAPVLQLVTGVFVYHEPMPASRLAGFGLVWAALLLLSGDGWRQARRSRARRRDESPQETPTIRGGSPAPG